MLILSIGSNKFNMKKNLRTAIKYMRLNRSVMVMRGSRFYRTKPVGGPGGQRNYLNGAVLVRTSLTPREVLDMVQEIEEEMGRVRTEHWGPRIIDVDILLYGEHIVREDDLEIPHPRMHKRRFVLQPAREIAPKMMHPIKRVTIAQLYKRVKPRYGRKKEKSA